MTHQRLEVAREIAGSDTHPDVETVYRGVRERVPTISLDTVYRTMAALLELGLVDTVEATAGPTRYDANMEPHHHFICRRCGAIHDIYSPALDTVAVPEELAALGAIDSIKVELRGVCADCLTKQS